MRHRVAHRKLGRITPHRIALLRNLATALFEKERIRTTLPKAKEVRSFAEKLITLARREDNRLHARRHCAEVDGGAFHAGNRGKRLLNAQRAGGAGHPVHGEDEFVGVCRPIKHFNSPGAAAPLRRLG